MGKYPAGFVLVFFREVKTPGKTTLLSYNVQMSSDLEEAKGGCCFGTC